jgi:hypothetical protein
MICIADAIAATLPLGSVSYEAQLDGQGQRLIWLEAAPSLIAWLPCVAPARATATSSCAWSRSRRGRALAARPPYGERNWRLAVTARQRGAP